MVTVSCSRGGNSHSLDANLATAETMVVDTSAFSLLPLYSEDGPIGNIMYGKAYGDILLLFDESARCLYQVMDSTVFVALDKVGRGPGEYIDIGVFTYIRETGEIVSFESASRSLRFYLNAELTRQIKLDYYVNAMETFASDHLLFAKESDYPGGPAAIIDYNLSTGEEKEVLSLREDQVELFDDASSFRVYNGMIYFCVSGPTTNIYSYGDDLSLVASISFSPDALGREYWRGQYDYRKEHKLMDAFESERGGLALGPCLLSITEDRMAFWYATGTGTYYHNLPDQALCVIANGDVRLYEQVLDPRDETTILQPVAVWGDSFISIGDTDEMTLIKFTL